MHRRQCHDNDLLLAFDFGLARIGVATGNTLTQTATPLATLETRRRLPWTRIDELIEEWTPGRIVVGVPSDDSSNPLVQRIGGFVATLRKRYGLPVETIDESHTSAEAAAVLKDERAGGIRRSRIKRGTLDRHAACLIAERWMRRTVSD
jgi:putative Holliday junction resolvase